MSAAAEAPELAAGVYDIPEADYFGASWALSCSGAKLLGDCPARFAWRQDHAVWKRHYDVGHAAHKLILGKGAEIIAAGADSYRTKAAQQARDAARAAGQIPLVSGELEQVRAMAAAIEGHELASALLDPASGQAEQSLFWRDERTGTWLRARLDWMRADHRIVDYKSCSSASPKAIAKAVADYKYFQQDAWYSDGYAAISGVLPEFYFVFQEKDEPYLVTVCELDDDTRRAGRARNAAAIDTWIRCTQAGEWPAYSDQIELISLPPWARPREDYTP